MGDTSTAVADAPVSSGASTSSTTSDTSSSAEPQVTTDRPSFRDALSVFNEAAKQQGKRPRGVKAAPLSPIEPPQPGAATTQPDGSIEGQPPIANKQGPIPFEVHSKALENARSKERQTVEQEYATRYGSPEVVNRAVHWFQHASRDRIGFLTGVINEAMADPQLAPHVASLAGRTLKGQRQPASPPQAAAAEAPPPDFQDGSGNQFYSAKAQQARDEWLMSRVRDQILGEVQPDLQAVEEIQNERQMERARAQVKQTMASHLTEARTWPYFKEHEAEIKAALGKEPLTSGHPAEEALLLSRVYQRVVGPKLSQLEQARVLADLKSRANASSLNPSATGAPSGVPKNVRAKDGGTFGAALKWAAGQTSGR